MSRYIDAETLKQRIKDNWYTATEIIDDIDAEPTVDVVKVKHGKWEEKEVIHAEEAKTAIEEWQTCRCSVCDRYDTRPYMYYFDNPNYCSWCGADMRKETTE